MYATKSCIAFGRDALLLTVMVAVGPCGGRNRKGDLRMPLSKKANRLSWVLQLVAAGILLQTLFFKFTGAPESVYIFETLGVEPWGRILSGLVELVASLLLLVPGTAALGGVLGMGVMFGAIGSHLTQLGIEVQGDGGLLFGMACVVFLCCAVVAFLRRDTLPVIGRR